jgi:hypothetical protein
MSRRSECGKMASMRLQERFVVWLFLIGLWMPSAACLTVLAGEQPMPPDLKSPSSSSPETMGEQIAPKTLPSRGEREEEDRPGVIPAKLFRYAERLIAKYGGQQSGQLERAQWAKLPKSLQAADLDGDGVITVDELAEVLAAFGRGRSLEQGERTWQGAKDLLRLLPPSPAAESAEPSGAQSPGPAADGNSEPLPPETGASRGSRQPPSRKFFVPPARLPPGLPDWFTARDLDGDGQLTWGEFAPEGGRAALEQFQRYDLNRDGLLTPDEVLHAGKPAGDAKQPRP